MKLKDIKLNPSNPRLIRDVKFDKLKQSIKDFPQMMALRPIIVDSNNVILGGNMRFKALQDLGYKDIPDEWIKHADELTNDQKKEFIIKDNVGFGEWDYDILANEFDIESLTAWGLDLPYDNEEVLESEEDNYEMPDTIETDIVIGDLFEIGEHRLLCGDSTDSDAVARLMNGEKALLMNTDPPYGIAYVKNAKSKGQSESFNDIENDELDGEKLQIFLEDTIRSALPFLVDNCPFYLWHPMLTQGTFFAAAAAAADILINRQIIWVKPSLVFGRGDYHWRHELCFYGWRRGHKPVFYGARNQTTIWEVGRENDKIHPTQKPVELFTIPINNHTKVGEIIYEPFSGSGSQFVSAEQLKRKCYGMELDPKYCQVIIDRILKLDPTIKIKKNGVDYAKT
jgi:DNA modification methylase